MDTLSTFLKYNMKTSVQLLVADIDLRITYAHSFGTYFGASPTRPIELVGEAVIKMLANSNFARCVPAAHAQYFRTIITDNKQVPPRLSIVMLP